MSCPIGDTSPRDFSIMTLTTEKRKKRDNLLTSQAGWTKNYQGLYFIQLSFEQYKQSGKLQVICCHKKIFQNKTVTKQKQFKYYVD